MNSLFGLSVEVSILGKGTVIYERPKFPTHEFSPILIKETTRYSYSTHTRGIGTFQSQKQSPNPSSSLFPLNTDQSVDENFHNGVVQCTICEKEMFVGGLLEYMGCLIVRKGTSEYHTQGQLRINFVCLCVPFSTMELGPMSLFYTTVSLCTQLDCVSLQTRLCLLGPGKIFPELGYEDRDSRLRTLDYKSNHFRLSPSHRESITSCFVVLSFVFELSYLLQVKSSVPVSFF